jgi:hypothetical protein
MLSTPHPSGSRIKYEQEIEEIEGGRRYDSANHCRHTGRAHSAVVRTGHPDAYCIPCLAGVLMDPERLVRDAAQLAMVKGGFCVERRTCSQCGRDDDALTVKLLD